MKLDHLTKEQKLALLDALEEKERRSRLKVDLYVPNKGQLEVHKSPHTLRAVFSGNGGGKTTLGVNEAKWAVEGYNPITQSYTPVPCRVIVVLDRPDKVEQAWLPEIKKWINIKGEQLQKKGKPYYTQITFDNGSFIQFMFHDAEPLAFESIECDVVIFDEPPPRHVYVALRRGGRTKGRVAKYLIIGTPISAAWMRKEIYEPWAKGDLKDTECFKFGTEVNKQNLAEGYIETFSSVLSDKEKRIRLHGDFFDLDGLALAHLFQRDKHVLKRDEYQWDKDKPCVLAIDPHPSKNHVAVLMGADEYGPVYIKEISRKETPRTFARTLKQFIIGYRVIDLTCDNLGSADMTGGEGFKSFIQVLKEEGLQVRPTTYDDKHDEDWISRIQDVLEVPTEIDNFGRKLPALRIMEGNIGIISDLETVEWQKYRNMDEYKQTLNIAAKDYLACLKYALATNLSYTKKKDKVFYKNKAAYGVGLKHEHKMASQAKSLTIKAKRRYI